MLLLVTAGAANADLQCIDLFANPKTLSTKFIEKTDLKVMSLNAERFFVLRPHTDKSYVVQEDSNARKYSIVPKSSEKIKELVRIINEEKPDILVLQEVIGLHSTKALDPNHEYVHIVNTPTDSSGIHTVFMVRASLDVDAQLVVPDVKAKTVKMHRGLPYIKLRQRYNGEKANRSVPPDMIVVGVHLKAYRNTEGENRFSQVKREEVTSVLNLKHELEAQYPDVKLMIAGDYNADVNVRPEAMKLKAELQDPLDYAVGATNRGSRATQTFHSGIFTEATQLDAHLLSASLLSHLRMAYIYRYKAHDGEIKLYQDASGNIFPYPTTYDLRSENISDHYPMISVFDMTASRGVEMKPIQEYQKKLHGLYAEITRKLNQWLQNDRMLYELTFKGEPDMFNRWLEVNQLSPFMEIEYLDRNRKVLQFRGSFTAVGYLLLKDSSNKEPWLSDIHFVAP
ncbi:MAG: hypothetical protein KDD37_05675 [Bdellovibrionales bacterium]|nr:hypothetical protein [Bdellovibrionales bacterium]